MLKHSKHSLLQKQPQFKTLFSVKATSSRPSSSPTCQIRAGVGQVLNDQVMQPMNAQFPVASWLGRPPYTSFFDSESKGDATSSGNVNKRGKIATLAHSTQQPHRAFFPGCQHAQSQPQVEPFWGTNLPNHNT